MGRFTSVGLVCTLLIAACGDGNSAPSGPLGIVVLTAGGTSLDDGATDVPPTLDLRVTAGRPLGAAELAVKLDGNVLAPAVTSAAATLSVPAMPLGSAHHLDLSVGGTAHSIGFHVVGLTGVMAAVHEEAGPPVVDIAFEHVPDHGAVAAAAAAASLQWRDDSRARITWATSPPSALDLPAKLPVSRGSKLAAALHIDLSDPGPGALRRVTVPAAALTHRPPVLAYTVGTVASRASAAAHAASVAALSPSGWRLSASGLSGAPDPAVASLSGTEVWPLVQNDAGNSNDFATALADAGHRTALADAIVSGVTTGGYPGIHLDLEGIAATARDDLTAFIRQLAGSLHSHNRKLMVDVVPHKPGHLTVYSAAYDLPAIAAVSDGIVLLSYDENTASTQPGPVAGLDWDTQLLDGSLNGLDASRVFLGIPLYARTWGPGGAVADSYASAVSTGLQSPGSIIDYDFGAATPFIRSSDASGASITYFDDTDSLMRKMALASSRGMAGVAAWRLGFEDPAWWVSAGR